MSIENIEKSIQRSHTFRGEATGQMRVMLEEYRGKVSEIQTNRELSREGKQNRISVLKKKYEKETLKLAKLLNDEDKKALHEAKVGAQKILTSALPTVNADKQKLYDQKLEELKAKAVFAANSEDAANAIREIARISDAPQLAANARGIVMNLSQKVIGEATNPNEALQLKQLLGQVYEDINERSLPENGKRARELASLAEQIENSDTYNETVRKGMSQITQLTGHYLDNPDAYFEKYQGSEGE